MVGRARPSPTFTPAALPRLTTTTTRKASPPTTLSPTSPAPATRTSRTRPDCRWRMPPFAVWQRPPPKEGSASGEVESQGRHDDGLTRNRLDQLFQHCADLGVMVEWADLGGRRHGHYRWRDDAIVLDLRLTAAQATACLAHELGHQRFGDTCSTPANER